jgi:hypothetical protein
MDVLVASLKDLEASALPDGDDSVVLNDHHHETLAAIQWLAQIALLDEQGQPLFAAIDRLYETYGYFVLPGERDASGRWTAYIRTQKGVIAFG